METMAPLVRAVIRAFYTDEYAVIIEPLLREPFYLEDDERTKGKLSQKFGGISSRRIRQILAQLELHSLVHKKEILVQLLPGEEEGENVTEETMIVESSMGEGGDQQQRIVRVKRFFYYIDFVHFVKLLSLRLSQCSELIQTTMSSQAGDVTQSTKYVCSECDRKFDVFDAMNINFMCPDDFTPLQEEASVGAAVTTNSGTSLTPQMVDWLKEKFRLQMAGELDQRDNIGDLLKQAQHAGPNLPENDPAKRIQQQENERRRLEALAIRNQESLPDVQEGATIIMSTEQRNAAELAPWLQVSSITGQMTEDAFRDKEERQARRARLEQAEVVNKESKANTAQDEDIQRIIKEAEEIKRRADQAAIGNFSPRIGNVEPAPNGAIQGGNPDAVFTFSNGKSVKAGDINENNLEVLREECPDDEYDAFFKFVHDNVVF
jgi:hypothetical protein